MIEGVSTYGYGTSSTSSTTKSADETMGKDAFLQLLVTQLENQDPLNPTDNTEFVAQLAQFSSLEGIQNLNTTLEGMTGSVEALQEFGSASLIGRSAKAESDSFSYEGGVERLGFSFDSDVTEAVLTVKDSSGETVREISLGSLSSGYGEAEWDGKNSSGTAAEAGLYSFSVEAKGSDGSSANASTFVNGLVTGVSLGENSALLIDGLEVSRDLVKEIY